MLNALSPPGGFKASSWRDEMAEFLRSGAIVLMGTIVIAAGVFVMFYG